MSNDNDSDNMRFNFRLSENIQSAYMLVYEKKKKRPLQLVVEEPNSEVNIISYKSEENQKIYKLYDLSRYSGNTYDAMEQTILNSVFYSAEKNEYYKYVTFYYKEKLLPSAHYLEVYEDNLSFEKHQNISDDHFTQFFDNIILALDETIQNLNNVSSGNDKEISDTLLNFIFNFLSEKDKVKLLQPTIEKLVSLASDSDNILQTTIEYVLTNKSLIEGLIYNDESQIVKAHTKLLFNLIKISYRKDPVAFLASKETENTEITISKLCFLLCEFCFDFFPRVPRIFLFTIYPFYNLFKDLASLGEEMIEYLFYKEAICLFVTYLIGRESPYYKDYAVDNQHWDNQRGTVSYHEALSELVFTLYKRTSDYQNNCSENKEPSENSEKVSNISFNLNYRSTLLLKETRKQ